MVTPTSGILSLTIPNGIGGDGGDKGTCEFVTDEKLSAGKKYNFSIVVIADNTHSWSHR